jgi:methylglyoxal synthase
MQGTFDPTYLSLLQQSSLLADSFSASEIEELAGGMSLRPFRADETLSREGEPADSAMVLLAGIAHVVIKEQRVATLQVGDFFGESAFSEDAVRQATVVARSDGMAAELTTEQFEGLTVEHPHLAWKYQRFFDSLRRRNSELNERFFYRDTVRYVALLAHNDKKAELIEFVKRHRWFFDKVPLVATGTTGTTIFQSTGITLSRKVSSGPLGGDQVIGSMVASDNILAVIFFRDPLSPHAHHADVEALGRVCDVYRVPFATNAATAEAVLPHVDSGTRAALATPDASLAKYQQHQGNVVEKLRGGAASRSGSARH